MAFEQDYTVFLQQHMKLRSGEGLRRLKEGHKHGEKLFLEQVWWPAVGNLEHLIPEYEVKDFKDGTRYLDFAYIRGLYRICFEIDGYGPHCRDVSRWQFADNLLRQNHMVMDGWKIFRFSYDDIVEKPRRCQQLVQQMLGRWFSGEDVSPAALNMKEQAVLRLALYREQPLTPSDISRDLGVSLRTAWKLLQDLTSAKWLLPASGNVRIRSYRINSDDPRLARQFPDL